MLTALLALSVGPQAQSARELQVVNDAAAALGGRDRLLAVKTLTIDGFGNNPNLGQQMTPESELLLWMLPDFKRTIDLEHGRMRVQFTRRPAFPAVFDNQTAPKSRGELLHYEQWNIDERSVVSFAGMAFSKGNS
jgi:hypothetical protein